VELKQADELETAEPKTSNRMWYFYAILLIILILGVVFLRLKDRDSTAPTSAAITKTHSTSVAATIPQTPASPAIVATDSKVTLSLSPQSGIATVGKILTVEIWVDSSDTPLNAVQINLSYPADKLQYVSIDGAGSAFEIPAGASGGDGRVTISRGHMGSVTKRQLVAKVNFKPLTAVGSAKVDFVNGTSAISATTNSSVLGQTISAGFELR
jgi:hypothetical protein